MRYPDALFQVWRYHRFLTNSDLSTTAADRTTLCRYDIGPDMRPVSSKSQHPSEVSAYTWQ